MGWYIELHCDTSPCPHGADQEGPQGRSTMLVAGEARRAGWIQDRDGKWRCAGCAPAFAVPRR